MLPRWWKPVDRENIHFELSLTLVHQSNWSCCSNPAPPLSCQRYCYGRQKRTTYPPSAPRLLPLQLQLQLSPGKIAPPPWSESGSHRRCFLPGNSPLWSYGRGTPETSPWTPHDLPWTARAHTGKQRAGDRSSMLQAPGSFQTSV